MKNLVVLISGRGSNLRAIVEACAAEGWPARIAGVISHRADAAGLVFAAERGIPTQVVEHRAYAERTAFDDALAAAIDGYTPDGIVLAGFMRILGDAFVQRYAGKLINIHPSLLPAFAGLHTHRRALEEGCRVAGATVHFVTPKLDHGPIVAQAVVAILPGDTEASLAARVLAAEHILYPRALRWWVNERLAVDGLRVTQLDGEPQLLV